MSALEHQETTDPELAAFWKRLARMPAPSNMRLTPELLEEILEPIARLGCHPETAAGRAGVPLNTWEKWRAQGKRDISQDVDSRYAEMERGITAAKAHATDIQLGVIRDADAWTSKAWILERIEPNKYGQRRDISVTHRALPMIDSDKLTIEEHEVLLGLLQKASPDPESQGLNKDRRPVLELMQADDVIEGTGSFSEAPATREPAIPKSPGA